MTPGPGVRVGLGWVQVRVWGLNGPGFSEQVTVPTRLLCPGFSHGWRACHKERQRDKWKGKRTMSMEGTVFTAMFFNKLIYSLVLGGLLFESAVESVSKKLHRPLGAMCTMTRLYVYMDACNRSGLCDAVRRMVYL